MDSLVRFSADSTLIGPTKEKIGPRPFIFYCLPSHISWTIGPTKSFTYQNLQEFMGKSTKVFSK